MSEEYMLGEDYIEWNGKRYELEGEWGQVSPGYFPPKLIADQKQAEIDRLRGLLELAYGDLNAYAMYLVENYMQAEGDRVMSLRDHIRKELKPTDGNT